MCVSGDHRCLFIGVCLSVTSVHNKTAKATVNESYFICYWLPFNVFFLWWKWWPHALTIRVHPSNKSYNNNKKSWSPRFATRNSVLISGFYMWSTEHTLVSTVTCNIFSFSWPFFKPTDEMRQTPGGSCSNAFSCNHIRCVCFRCNCLLSNSFIACTFFLNISHNIMNGVCIVESIIIRFVIHSK